MKCACGEPSCKAEISVDTASATLAVTGNGGQYTLIYLNANSAVELIKQLKRMLLDMAEVKE
jgi:hypothetical protein